MLQRNAWQVQEVIAKAKRVAGGSLYKKTVAAFGLAFKAGTADVRNSLALKIVSELQKEGAIVQAYDPMAAAEARRVEPNILCCESPYDAARNAEVLLVLTEWPSFGELDYRQVKTLMARPSILDARNLLDPAELRGLGFTYVGIGLP